MFLSALDPTLEEVLEFQQHSQECTVSNLLKGDLHMKKEELQHPPVILLCILDILSPPQAHWPGQ